MKKAFLSFMLIASIITAGYFILPKNTKTSESDAVVFSLGHNMPTNSALHQSLVRLKEDIYKKSSKKIDLKIFPKQSLGNDQKMVYLLKNNELDIAIPPTSKIVDLVPELRVFDIPFLFDGRKNLYEALESKATDDILKKFEKMNIFVPTIFESGFKQFSANKKLSNPNDFAGLKFRVMKSPILRQQAILLKSFPFNVDFHHVYKELVSGNISAQENPFNAIYFFDIYKAQSHILKSNHAYISKIFLMNKSSLNRLSDDLKSLFIKEIKNTRNYHKFLVSEEEMKAINGIAKHGTKIVKLADRKPFIDTFKSLYYSNREIIQNFKPFISKDILPHLKDHTVIGLNAAFAPQYQDSSQSLLRGAEFAVDALNKKKLPDEKPYMLMVYDHGGFPANGIRNLKELKQKHGAVAVIGGMHSPVVLAELSTVKELKLPYLIPWAAATPIVSEKNRFVFRASVRDEYAGAKLATFALKKSNKVAILLESTGWGASNEKSISKALAGKEYFIQKFPWGTKIFTPFLNKIKEFGAGVIIYVGNSPEALHLVKSMVKTNSNLPIVSHWGITGGSFFEQSEQYLKDIELNFLQTYILEDKSSSQAEKTFFNEYRKRYGLNSKDKIPAPFGTVHVVDLVNMLNMAIERSPSLDGDTIARSLKNIRSHQGILKEYKDPFKGLQDALNRNDIRFGKYDHNGNIIYAH